MLESPSFIVDDSYDGSRTFTWLADLCGLSVDLVNFLLCQISALFLASLFRSILHPSKVTSAVRHIFALSLGLLCGYFCFGKQAIHIAGLPTVCYIVIRTQSPRVVQRHVMLVAMTYLLCIHLIRQIYDYGSHSLDITGPLMIITQKVTSLAFSLHDGFVRESQDLTKAQQYHAVRKMPTALEFFSYVLHFQGLMAGPLVFYKDYIEFVEGYNLLKRPHTNGNLDNSKHTLIVEPSPTKTVVKKVIGSLICAFIYMKFVKMYPVREMMDDDFIENSSMAYRFWYAMMATSCIRFKYYHAWLLADAICNNSGLGFTGYDKDGNSNWDLISNINVLGFEFATNMRDAINNWNCCTNRWLRMIVYERVPKKYGTVLTFSLSAVWHGFYPGYYLTFATGAVMVTAGRMARRMLRHRFQATQFTRMFYDIVTCLTTRLVMGYATFPFVLLEFMGSIRLYLNFYMCLHLIALATIFVLPKFVRGEKRSNARNSSVENEKLIADTEDAVRERLEGGSATKVAEAIKTDDDEEQEAVADDVKLATKKTNKPHNSDTAYKFNGNGKFNGHHPDHDDNDNDDDVDHRNQNVVNNDSVKNISLSNDLNKEFKPKTPISIETTQTTTAITSTTMPSKQHPQVPTTCAREAVAVPHDQCEMDQLSSKLKEKIDAETKNIEEFIDKTVTETVSGIVEFKNDLMRDLEYPTIPNQDGLRKRTTISNGTATEQKLVACNAGMLISSAPSLAAAGALEESAAFLKKEIEAVVQQANVLPAVLSNGHAK